MKRFTEEEIREIQRMKNSANVAGLLMANPPKPEKGGKEQDDVQGRTDTRK